MFSLKALLANDLVLNLVPGGGYPVCIVPKFRGYLGTGTRVMRFSSRNAYENGFLEARRGKVEKWVGTTNRTGPPGGARVLSGLRHAQRQIRQGAAYPRKGGKGGKEGTGTGYQN